MLALCFMLSIPKNYASIINSSLMGKIWSGISLEVATNEDGMHHRKMKDLSIVFMISSTRSNRVNNLFYAT